MSNESMDLAVETADLQCSQSETALEPKGAEFFKRENVVRMARAATATVLIVAIPGAGIAALVGGLAYWIRAKGIQGKVGGR